MYIVRSISPAAALLLVCAASGLATEFSRETGSYVFQNYTPRAYGAAPENWALAQDRRGVTYVANTDGLLEFDGVSWRMIHLPSGQLTRSVTVDKAGIVYAGGVGDFGTVSSDAGGSAQFVSLLSRVPQADRQFGDVWRILSTSRGVYFSAYNRLFRLNADGTIRTWRPQSRFGKAMLVSDSIYVKTPEQGLLVMSGDELTPVPGGDRLASTAVQDAVAVDGGTLIATSDHLFLMTRTGIELFRTHADDFFAKNLIYSMLTLPGGYIAVGTRKGGLAIINRQGALERTISKADGLLDNYVSSLQPDPQGGIWVLQVAGISRLNPGLTRYIERDGVHGQVETFARHDGAMYAGTTSGLLRMETHAGEPPHFESVAGIATAALALLSIDHDLLVATNSGIYNVSGTKATRIVEETREQVFDLSRSLRDPGTVYAAGHRALYVLHREGKQWRLTGQLPAPANQEFRSVLEDDDGTVWATTSLNVWRVDFRQQPLQPQKFGAAEGIPAGWLNVRRLDNRIVFATEKGLRRYSPEGDRFEPDLSLGAAFGDGSRDVFNIFQDAAGDVWITGKRYHAILRKQASGYRLETMPLLHSGIEEIYWLYAEPNGLVWATGADGILFRYEPDISGNPNANLSVLTRRIQVIGKKEFLYNGAGNFKPVRLPWAENALHFEFATPFYEEPSTVEYQVRLEGSDSEWTPWSHETKRDYTHLPEKSYSFHVRARTPHGPVNEETVVSFGVLPPWYRTWWAYLIYAVLGIMGVYGIVRLRTRQLEEDKRKLEVIVEERTVEIRHQRDEIQVQERKAHSLLLNILPAKVADELKTTGAVAPVGFDDVTVCFTDFVGFTVSSEKMQPTSLVDALNNYFTAFDEIIGRYGLEKLKTIGDSYMFVSGLPVQRKSHAVDAVLAALEMVEVVRNLAAKAGGTGWNIRVGLHSGPVIAGVVGTRKFAFDIWGNTVNFAARMESSGVPGRVNLSERTCQLLRGLIDCEARGQVKIKEGRELTMFLAAGPARELAGGQSLEGIPRAFAARYREVFGEDPHSFPASYTEEGVNSAAAGSAVSVGD